MKYKYILFDLDGTITESGPGIVNSVEYALHKLGYEEKDRESLKRFIGPPLTESMMKFYKMTEEQADQGVVYYREYYVKKGIFENSIYDGFIDSIKKLKEAGLTLAVATSKPEKFAKIIADKFDFAKYFACVCGATMDEARINKADVIRYTLDTLGISEEEKKSVLMVGDREHDILGAKANGLDGMGVLYGYGDRKELENAGADYIVNTTNDIADLILEL
ncbi:MAG: HAD family hydrolase [Bariatricus sp.]|nr:HAD family hydrolase [Bariatricus sp.]